MPAEHRIIVKLAAATGYRIGDICSAKTTDYDPDEGTLTLIEQKTGKERTVSIAPGTMAWSLLTTHNALRPSSRTWLIEPSFGKPANRKTVWYWMHRAAEWCGITEDVILSPHSLRKYYAVQQRLSGKSLQDVQHDLNHDRPETTMLYYYADMLSGKPDTFRPVKDIFTAS